MINYKRQTISNEIKAYYDQVFSEGAISISISEKRR